MHRSRRMTRRLIATAIASLALAVAGTLVKADSWSAPAEGHVIGGLAGSAMILVE